MERKQGGKVIEGTKMMVLKGKRISEVNQRPREAGKEGTLKTVFHIITSPYGHPFLKMSSGTFVLLLIAYPGVLALENTELVFHLHYISRFGPTFHLSTLSYFLRQNQIKILL